MSIAEKVYFLLRSFLMHYITNVRPVIILTKTGIRNIPELPDSGFHGNDREYSGMPDFESPVQHSCTRFKNRCHAFGFSRSG